MYGLPVLCTILVGSLSLLELTSAGNAVRAHLPRKVIAREDPFVAFLRMILSNVRQKLPKGLPELGLPPLDPLDVGGLYLDESPFEGFVDLEGNVWNATIAGVSDFKISALKFQVFPKPHLELALTWPQIALTGQYDLHGKFSTSINFAGKGPFSIKAKEITFSVDVLLFLKGLTPGIEHVNLDLKVKTFIAYFHNVFGGGFAEQIANKFLTSMMQTTFNKKVRPEVVKAGESLKDILANLLGSV